MPFLTTIKIRLLTGKFESPGRNLCYSGRSTQSDQNILMNQKFYILILFGIFFYSCQEKEYQPAGLIKLTESELIEGAKQKRLPNLENAVFKNEQGEEITSDSIKKIPDLENWTIDFYSDSSGAVKEAVLRKATKKDKQVRQKIKEAFAFEPTIKLVEIDCKQKREILQNVFESDQKMRTKGGNINYNKDRQNLATVISLIEKCGMPTLKEVDEIQMAAVWLVFQHGDNGSRKKYLPILEQAAKNGDLKAIQIAMMKDRTLMEDGRPQVYGTQVTKMEDEWILYDLENPETVNKRREEMGFEPLQDYLRRWDIEFKIEQVH